MWNTTQFTRNYFSDCVCGVLWFSYFPITPVSNMSYTLCVGRRVTVQQLLVTVWLLFVMTLLLQFLQIFEKMLTKCRQRFTACSEIWISLLKPQLLRHINQQSQRNTSTLVWINCNWTSQFRIYLKWQTNLWDQEYLHSCLDNWLSMNPLHFLTTHTDTLTHWYSLRQWYQLHLHSLLSLETVQEIF